MNRIAPRSRLALAVALAVGSSLLVLNAGASAAERGGHRAVPRGDHTRVTVKQRTETGRTRSDTWTGADGRTASRNAVVVNDREAGVRTRTVDLAGPNGGTASRQDVTTKTDDGYTRSSTFTGPQGKVTTREASRAVDADAGTRTRNAVTTLPDGRTRTMNDVATRTEDGYTRSTTVVNPNGGTVTRDVTASFDADTKAVTKTVSVDRTPADVPAMYDPATSVSTP